ncbi:MAG: hypothetical protein GY854_10760 [Deltaproteobacteria bacterium]|nr:hypothetical protein [Deltaproteobacteria bacterium]
MSRIPFRKSDARPTWLAVVLMAVIVTSCFPENDRTEAPPLLISPSSAKQGDMLALSLTAEGINFDECDSITAESFTFIDASVIAIHAAKLHDSDMVKAYIEIDDSAEAGAYSSVLRCDPMTKLEGTFEVKQRSDPLNLTLHPFSGAAGQPNRLLTLSVETNFFEAGTFVVFGDGKYITVKNQTVVTPTRLEIVVDISRDTPVEELEIVAITGSRTARGTFAVTERVESTIQVTPNVVKRPVAGTGQTTEWTLMISGTNVNFVAPTEDAGLDDPNASKVAFFYGDDDTQAPGIDITKVDVRDAENITINILVHESANLGPTPLRVTTGDQKLETLVTVETSEADPFLRFSPETVPRGCRKYPIEITATNFVFGKPMSMSFVEQGCSIHYWIGDEPSKHLATMVTVDADFSGDYATLKVKADGKTIQKELKVSDNLGLLLNPVETPLIQGGRGIDVQLFLRGGTFDPQAEARVLPRSGIAIRSQTFRNDMSIIELEIDIADDAPLGPVLIQVDNVDEVLETATLTILASNDVPVVNVQPIWLAQGRRIAVMEVESTDFEIRKDTTEFSFDDPAIHILSVKTDDTDTHRAELTVELSPAIRSGMSLLYVRTGEDLAAASFLVIANNYPHVAKITPSVVSRGEKRSMTVYAPQINFEEPVPQPQIMSDTGIIATNPRVDLNDKHTLRFYLELADTGPGGSIGILITSGPNNVVVLVHVDAGNSDDLTMKLEPSSISPGLMPQTITVSLPLQERFNLFSEVFTDIPNAYTSSFEASATEATFLLDVGYDVEVGEQGIPIFVTTSSGVAVGFITLNEEPRYEVSSTTPWQEDVTIGETYILDVNPGNTPSIMLSSLEHNDLADVKIDLLSTNGLDIAEESRPDHVWITENAASDVVAIVSPLGDPEGLPARVEIKPLGGRVTNHVESPNANTEPEWTLTSDPCKTPFLGAGDIGGALDLDRIAVDQTNCRLAVTAIARNLAQRPWDTPDLWLSIWKASGEPIGGILSTGWPTAEYPDPKIYLDDGLNDVQITIGAQVGSAGDYLINIHRPYLIRELGRSPYVSYIEIEVDPSASLDALSLELIDVQTGTTLENLSLAGETAPEDGIFLICIDELPEVDLVHPIAVLPDEGAFAIRLLENGTLVDAVQVGWGSDSFGEGIPVPNEEHLPILSRALGIDTNDNSDDFIGGWIGTPGK